MFPTPIAKTSAPTRWLYQVALPIALIVWLLPIIAVALTSLRGQGDIASGNYWGLPTQWQVIENYSAVFTNTPILR